MSTAPRPPGALAGLRVLDLGDESTRFAGKLLSEAGADVLRLRRGAPGRPLPGDTGRRGGVLDWWFDGGTRRLAIDLDTPPGRVAFGALVERADLLFESCEPEGAARCGLDHAELRARNPRLVQVSLTPYGRSAGGGQPQVSDLVASALGGVLAVSGTDGAPLNAWGRQCFNVAGFYAAICGLAGVRAARRSGQGVHVDLSLVQSVVSCTEQVLMYWFFQNWFPGGVAARQGSLHWTGLYEVMRCASGHAMVAVAPEQRAFFDWMIADGAAGSLAESPPKSPAEAFARAKEIMALARLWVAEKDAEELCVMAQARNLAFGRVRELAEAATCPQLAARGFLREVEWDGPSVRTPHPLFRLADSPAPPPAPPPDRATSLDEALAGWPARGTSREAGAARTARPLAGLRILDFTWVLAGPFATRVLGDLGADVVKIQTEVRSQGANSNEFPFFVMWNRSKRGVTLDMGHPRARETFRRLVERADVVIENFSHGVLDRWGIGYAAAREWNPGVIYVAMAGCGADGPWRDWVTYAPTIHALCGLTALTNPPERRDIGLGVSLTDHASGLAAALAVLEALEVRDRTGRGQAVDVSQLEIGAYLIGPAYLEELATGRGPTAAGNRDGFEDPVPNEVYRCPDGFLALTARDDADWRGLCGALGDAELSAEPALATLDGRRAARARIDARIGAWAACLPVEEAVRRLQECRVPAAKVQDARDLAENDPRLATRSWLAELPHASVGRQQVDAFPAWFDGEPLVPERASPALGEHTIELYAEWLGMDEAEIAEAIADGLFA